MEKDYHERFDKYAKMGKVLRKVYEQYVIRERLDKLGERLNNEARDLTRKIKDILEIV